MPHRDHSEIEGLETTGVGPGASGSVLPLTALMRENGDAAANTSTSAAVDVGAFFSGTLSTGTDSDWIRVELQAGQQYTAAITGTGALSASVDDPLLRLRDASGTVIGADDDSGPDAYSTLTFTASSTGSYYIQVSSKSTGDSGTYGVSITQGSRASYNAEMAAGALMRPDLSWAGTPETGATVSWAIRSAGPSPSGNTWDAQGFPTAFITPSASQVAAITEAMGYLDDLSGLTLNQVNPGGTSNSATILFGAYDSATDGAGAFAFYPGSTASSDYAGDVWLNNEFVATGAFDYGSFSAFVILHEIGHAIGLAHPGEYNAAPGTSITYANNAQFIQDSNQYTVMSYFDQAFTGSQSSLGYPDTFMLYDLLAIHELYGANTSYNSGDTTYGFNATDTNTPYDFSTNATPFLSIYDGAGTDTIDLSGYSMAQVLNLAPGTFSDIGGYTGNMSIAFGARIENAKGGGGGDDITGNGARNVIEGNGGADVLRGGTNADTLAGGQGNDTLFGNSSTDILYGQGGNDELRGGDGVDQLFGGLNDDFLIGHNGWDSLYGGSGNDTLYGSSGADILNGEGDNDWLSGGTAIDTLNGGNGNDTLYGNFGADILNGQGGNDELWGGSAIDTLNGGAGRDTLYGNEGADILNGNGGHDELWGGTGDDNLRGNGDNDTLYGGQGVDTLNGGDGDDFLRGGTLSDTFVFAAGNDWLDDFRTAEDFLVLEDALWTGTLSAQQVLNQFGSEIDGNYVLDFGGGTTLTFNGPINEAELVSLISFI